MGMSHEACYEARRTGVAAAGVVAHDKSKAGRASCRTVLRAVTVDEGTGVTAYDVRLAETRAAREAAAGVIARSLPATEVAPSAPVARKGVRA